MTIRGSVAAMRLAGALAVLGPKPRGIHLDRRVAAVDWVGHFGLAGEAAVIGQPAMRQVFVSEAVDLTVADR